MLNRIDGNKTVVGELNIVVSLLGAAGGASVNHVTFWSCDISRSVFYIFLVVDTDRK